MTRPTIEELEEQVREGITSTRRAAMIAALAALPELAARAREAEEALAVADHLAEWCRVTVSVDGVFSNNLGAQAQAQGMSNIVTRYIAARERSTP